MKKKDIIELPPAKPYQPAPHPMQHRIDEFRKIPSLWTPGMSAKGK